MSDDLFDFGERVDRYAVMGNPIEHSRSPRIHSLFAEQTGQAIEYTAIQVDIGGFRQAVGNFSASGAKGLNITVPFKEEAWALVNDRSPRAEQAGAVNTIKIEGNQSYGDNTDGIGLVNDLQNNLSYELRDKRILIMGAGGAARGIIAPILEQQPELMVIANRTPDKAAALASHFGELGKVQGGGYGQLAGLRFDIVLNATAASLKGEVPDLPEDLLADNALCYDLMYGAKPTAFLAWAADHDASQISDGLGMLVEQAAESFYIWRGVRPDTQPVIQAIRYDLNSSE